VRRLGVLALVSLGLALPAAAGTASGPSSRESIGATIARIQEALRTKGCSPRLRALFHSAYGRISAGGCTYLRKSLGTFTSPHGAVYGTAAEIDAGTGLSVPATTILTLDSDHRFHVVFVQFEYGSIGSKPGPAFDRNARVAIAALRRGDCRAFVKVAFRAFGLGGGPESAVCSRLPRNSLHRALAADPRAAPVRIGGNALYAFYGLRVGGRYYTVVMAQQAPSTKIPLGSAQYAYVDAYPA
jgi:hypothetical protein